MKWKHGCIEAIIPYRCYLKALALFFSHGSNLWLWWLTETQDLLCFWFCPWKGWAEAITARWLRLWLLMKAAAPPGRRFQGCAQICGGGSTQMWYHFDSVWCMWWPKSVSHSKLTLGTNVCTASRSLVESISMPSRKQVVSNEHQLIALEATNEDQLIPASALNEQPNDFKWPRKELSGAHRKRFNGGGVERGHGRFKCTGNTQVM